MGLAPVIGRTTGTTPVPLHTFLLRWTMATFALNMVIFGMIAGVFHAALYYRDLRMRQLRESDLEARPCA